jgi:cytochrome b6
MFLYDWCEERLEFQSIADDILAKFVPPHVNIFYCFGGIMLTSFIFQGGSGFALTIYYQPTVVEAFPSVQLILYHVNLGWFIKSSREKSFLLNFTRNAGLLNRSIGGLTPLCF